MLARLDDVSLTPSARVLQQMREQDVSFFRLAKQLSAQQTAHFVQTPLAAAPQQAFTDAATRSLCEQADVEAASLNESFETYLARYFAQYDTV